MRRTNCIELLEQRIMLSAVPVVSEHAVAGGLELRISGTVEDDHLVVTQADSGLLVEHNSGWSHSSMKQYRRIRIDAVGGNNHIELDPSVTTDAILIGGEGDDVLIGGSGNDRIYAVGGSNRLIGGAGDDILVSIGGERTDVLTGGGGRNIFWLDAAASETITDRQRGVDVVNRVGRIRAFRMMVDGERHVIPVTKDRGIDLPDPVVNDERISYRSFSDRPLFSDDGPSPDDVSQGFVGNCFFLAAVSSVAKANPDQITRRMVDLEDGTYLVRFARGAQRVYVRVDADLPAWPGGQLAYAGLGQQDSLWVAVIEKAYAFFRTNAGSYDSISSGWMGEAYRSLGLEAQNRRLVPGPTALLRIIQRQLERGRAVSFAVGIAPASAPVVWHHAYMVDAVLVDEAGSPVALRLRNPWGIDGAGDDGVDDGYVTLSARQAFDSFSGMSVARV